MNELGLAERQPQRFLGNPKRVLAQFFCPGDERRCRRIIERILAQPLDRTREQLEAVLSAFSSRHADFTTILERHFAAVARRIPQETKPTPEQRLLIGSYFTKEYSIEAAALFNPSMTPHPDQKDVPVGSLRYLLSLRATGEGHISSITFASGLIEENGRIVPDEPPIWATSPLFVQQNESGETVIEFPAESALNERVVFPLTDDERNGIEDLRLVRFADEDGNLKWYGTFTAYDGRTIRSKLLQTTDFRRFSLRPLVGTAVSNKGMALFPTKIDGQFAMISRLDGENLYFMTSKSVDRWDKAVLLQTPEQPWEWVQIGNCGSPIETNEGWLLLSHGVGPMRTYAVGAYLLDRRNPAKVIGRLPRPLLSPNSDERDGYVPNVVYSCGGIRHSGRLIIPYAMSDYAYGFAVVDLNKLLQHFV
ncbi:MAG: glycoside hydrolase family 130 protein [candidate division KSB1 bacterium]|nr:glycoside hydrolase family 130 protein [candidate division KSB1 bacterium]